MDGYDRPMHGHLSFPGDGGLLYGAGGSGHDLPLRQLGFTGFHHLQPLQQQQHQPTSVKTEYGAWQDDHETKFQFPPANTPSHERRCSGEESGEAIAAMKSKIVAHPQYPNLIQAYIDCHKVGAPPETVARLVQLRQDLEPPRPTSGSTTQDSSDPELDRFMEAYCNMLVKLREKLTTPLEEAMEFMRTAEAQLSQITNPPPPTDHNPRGDGGSADGYHGGARGGEEESGVDPRAMDPQLKNYLRNKYRGYLSTLKQEFSRKKKKGKLPREARQKMLTWWQLHYKWPYPSESEKVALGEATGLDQKQINNWFINQRKRHWKPSDEVELMVMDGLQHHHCNGAQYLGHGPYSLGP